MNIKDTFLELTKKTYPFGFETDLEYMLPKGYIVDDNGNYFYKIGESKTAFTCHLDTACKEQVYVNHTFEDNYIKTDGKSILGADDKAGMTVMLYMIENNVPGLYCFFVGEEVGCIGSGLASMDKYFTNYDRMISFDRRGTESIITFQSSKRCCSDEFATALANDLNRAGMNMKLDDTGVYTDSAEFTKIIPECTNISVGYYNEHTKNEKQDVKHLVELCMAAVLVDWENLPTKRNKNIVEYKPVTSYSYPKYFKNTNKATKSKSSKYGYREYEDFEYYEVDDYSNYTTKKASKKIEIDYYSENRSKNYYEHLKQLLIADGFTKDEFEKVKHMYLDLNDPQDLDFYLDMKEMIKI